MMTDSGVTLPQAWLKLHLLTLVLKWFAVWLDGQHMPHFKKSFHAYWSRSCTSTGLTFPVWGVGSILRLNVFINKISFKCLSGIKSCFVVQPCFSLFYCLFLCCIFNLQTPKWRASCLQQCENKCQGTGPVNNNNTVLYIRCVCLTGRNTSVAHLCVLTLLLLHDDHHFIC